MEFKDFFWMNVKGNRNFINDEDRRIYFTILYSFYGRTFLLATSG